MTIPFLDVVHKAKAFFRSSTKAAAASTRALPVEKPSNERLSKTVMPNTTRTVAPRDVFELASGNSPARAGGGSTVRSAAAGSRTTLPPVVALALEPKVERTISLQLSDILAQIPDGFVKPMEALDSSRRILLKASEVERGMAAGKPTVSLAAVYEQMPEIFLRSVQPSDATQLGLPFDKVLQQFTAARVRTDQERDQNVPQVETPILQVTIEDTTRFGTTMEPLQASDFPSVKVETASASSHAAAEPEMVVREPARPTTRPTIPLDAPFSSTPEQPRVVPPAPSQPTRIPFNLPPNGTGESASERVPASSGPPVPTRPPRNTFKVSPPSDALRPKKTLVPGRERKEKAEDISSTAKEQESASADVKIAIPLRLILQSVPPFQLNGNASDVPADVAIQFPFSLIQPQLASGRIAIAPKVFQAAMPPNLRELLIIDSAETAVLLPLQEVLKNIPSAALRVRTDQEQTEVADIIETPFSIKAREDAERFKKADAPPQEAIDKIDTQPADTSEPEKTKVIDAKEVVARANALAGVIGCSVTFADGLILAGSFPDEVAVEGLCAMAPSLLQRIERHMLDTNLGPLQAMTLHGEKSAVTFFMHNNICVTALHGVAALGVEIQNQLAEMAKELSRIYAQPETAHVDH